MSIVLPAVPALAPAEVVVFDKDGVLVDFAPLWLAIARYRAEGLAERCGLEAAPLLAEAGVRDGRIDPTGPLATGTRREELTLAASFLYRHGFDWLEAKALAEAAFDAADQRAHAQHLVATPGPIVPALEHLLRLGARLAVATSDTTAGAERDLETLGIRPLFAKVVGADQVERSKPDPQMLATIAAALGVAPTRCWMVGDALSDLQMARALGAGAVGVASGVSPAERLEPAADVVLGGVWDLLGCARA